MYILAGPICMPVSGEAPQYPFIHLGVERHPRNHLILCTYEWRDTSVPIYTPGSRGTPVPIYTPGSGKALQYPFICLRVGRHFSIHLYTNERRCTPEPIYTPISEETLESRALSIIHTSCQRGIAITEDI